MPEHKKISESAGSGDNANNTLVAGLGGGNTLVAGHGTDALYASFNLAQWQPAVTAGENFNVIVAPPVALSSTGPPIVPSASSLDHDFQILHPNDTTIQNQLNDFPTLASADGISQTDGNTGSTVGTDIQQTLENQSPSEQVGDLINTLLATQLNAGNDSPQQLETLAFLLAQDPAPNSQLIASLLYLAQPPQQNFNSNDAYLLQALLLNESYQLFGQQIQLTTQLNQLRVKPPPPFANWTNAQQAQLTFLTAEDNQVLADEIRVNNQLLDYSANNLLVGGSGTDSFYGFAGNDTILGGSGDQILVLQADGAIALGDDIANPNGIQVQVNGQALPYDLGDIGNISGINVVAVQTGNADGDTVDVNLATLPPGLTGLQVQLGNGDGDLIDATTLSARPHCSLAAATTPSRSAHR